MDTLNAGAFLLGYLQKKALDPAGPQQAYTGQLPNVGNTFNAGAAAQNAADQGGSPFAQLQQGIHNFASNPQGQDNRMMATSGMGAGAGALIGRALGGDMASTIMGAGLGGLLTYLAQTVFPGQIDKAWKWIADNTKQGTLPEAIDQLAEKDSSIKQHAPANVVEKAEQVVNQQVATDAPNGSLAEAEAAKKAEGLNKIEAVTPEAITQGAPTAQVPQQASSEQLPNVGTTFDPGAVAPKPTATAPAVAEQVPPVQAKAAPTKPKTESTPAK
jgi:hypothetical protein